MRWARFLSPLNSPVVGHKCFSLILLLNVGDTAALRSLSKHRLRRQAHLTI